VALTLVTAPILAVVMHITSVKIVRVLGIAVIAIAAGLTIQIVTLTMPIKVALAGSPAVAR